MITSMRILTYEEALEEALAIIENIYEGDTIYHFDYYDDRQLPLSWEVNRDTLEQLKDIIKKAKKI